MTEKLLKATHRGTVTVGDVELDCAVLEDGTRIVTRAAAFEAFGRPQRGPRKGDQRAVEVPAFIDALNLQSLISSDLLEVIKPINYLDQGVTRDGFNATILPLSCNLYLKAREAGLLQAKQVSVAMKCEILMRGLAITGITALVDEATGYQEVRDREALQKILDKYITDELAKWTKTFPDEFYKQLFRLKGMAYPAGASGRKPGYIGHWTNDIVYRRLAPAVLTELKSRNPKNERGNPAHKLHQSLTPDYGNPKLKQHLDNLIFLMRGCTSWADFERLLNRTSPKFDDTMPIEFPVAKDAPGEIA